MNRLPPTPETRDLARRIVWFEAPEQALANPVRFLAYLMTYATPEDLVVAQKYLTRDDFREALQKAPPGIMDARSWAYWHVVTGTYPAPPMPHRTFPAGPAATSSQPH